MADTIALYLRISADDEKITESDSVTNQRDLIRAYIANDASLSACKVLEFADDGWSGTNFERPQVKALLELARHGGVQCIVVKDISRWGRNYPEVSEYLDQIFPFLGVRFISVNDHYDSNDYIGRTVPMDVAFSSIIHDVYCKDLSVKIRQSYETKIKKGEYWGASPPFGYVISKTKRHHLEIDNDAAEIIRRVFALACEGNNTTDIATILNSEGVETRYMYFMRKGIKMRGGFRFDENNIYWTTNLVYKIIREERYTGVMVGGVRRSVNPGSGKHKLMPESEWFRVPDAHDAIVSEEVFKKANAVIPRRGNVTPRGKSNPLTKKLKCGCCGHSLELIGKAKFYYQCRGVRFNGGKGCFAGKLYHDALTEVILSALKAEARKTLDGRRQRKAKKNDSLDREAIAGEIKRLSARIVFLENRSIKLYEDFADGKLEQDAFLAVKAANTSELEESRVRVEEYANRLAVPEQREKTDDNKPLLRRVLDAIDLTDEVLSLVERINVYDENRIEIQFSFGEAKATKK